jgi:flagellar biosynthetic protein FliR
MTIQLDVQWLLGVLLIATRLAVLLLMSPLLILGRIPTRIVFFMTMIFAVAINNCVQQYTSLAIISSMDLVVGMIRELSIGFLMAFGLHCAFAAFEFGGRILDLQMGFGVANLLNPATHEQSPLLGTALLMTGVMTFYLLQGHHWIAKSILQSYQWFPLGGGFPELHPEPVIKQFGLMFSLGMLLVSPAIIVLLLLDGAMAIAVRTMPQVNIFMLSIPVKIAIGLLVLAMSVPLLKDIFQTIFLSIFSFWSELA